MSQQASPTKSNRVALSRFAIAVAVTLMAVASTGTSAHEPAPNSDQKDQTTMQPMKDMEGMSMSGDVDYDFAANMRKHHQMAVDMAQAELKNGKNPQLLKMAKNIIAAQNKEIAVLDQWTKAHNTAMKKAMPKTK